MSNFDVVQHGYNRHSINLQYAEEQSVIFASIVKIKFPALFIANWFEGLTTLWLWWYFKIRINQFLWNRIASFGQILHEKYRRVCVFIPNRHLHQCNLQLEVQSFGQFHSWARISHKPFKSSVNLVKTSSYIVYVHDFELQFPVITYNFSLFAILHTFYHFIVFLRDKKSHFISCTKYSISQLSIKFVRFLFYVSKI